MVNWRTGEELAGETPTCGTSECWGLQQIDPDFRGAITEHCQRCQGAGGECLVGQMCELVADSTRD